MRDQIAKLYLCFGVLLLSSACTTTTENKIQAGEAQWAALAISSYEIEVVEASIWHAQTYIITVEAGAIINAEATCIPAPTEGGTCEVQPFVPEEFTVPGLFALANNQAQIAEGKWTEIEIDETYGFPRRIAFDDEESIDDEIAWRVTDFTAGSQKK